MNLSKSAERASELFEKLLETRPPTERKAKRKALHDSVTRALAQEKGPLVVSASGATSSHNSPFAFNCTYEGTKLTSLRFVEGNRTHEAGNPVYSEANWLKAFHARDVQFFRNRAGHVLEHIIDEMRGKDDLDPGGNLGAVGWWQDVMAYVKAHDRFLYGAIQGKWNIEDAATECWLAASGPPFEGMLPPPAAPAAPSQTTPPPFVLGKKSTRRVR